MKTTRALLLIIAIISISPIFAQQAKLENNKKMYSNVWDEIINDGKIDLINDTNFATDVTLITSPENIVGIDGFKAYYQNFLTGFSNISFEIVNIFGEGDQLVKHWKFKGTHSGEFFGMPPTGKSVDVEGVTLVKMKDGKIAQEQDFMDNMLFMQQLGLISNPENLSTVENLYKAFNSGDMPTVMATLDPNIDWNEAEGNKYADGNPYKGADAVLNGVFSRIGEDYETFKLSDIQLYEMSNNKVLATLRYQGKLKKNSAVIDAQAAHLWTLKDGKMIAFQQYVDTKQLNDAENK